MVTTQDVSFGMLWSKLVGAEARWAPGDDDVAALEAPADSPSFGIGLVAVWVASSGPTLICHPNRGLKALKAFPPGAPIDDLRNALRESGSVVREESDPRRDTMS